MILLTIGTMLPFDRLVRAVDVWAAANEEQEVVAQIGESATYLPKHMRWSRLVTPLEFATMVDHCRLLVAHAGTGSYFAAAKHARPIVMFPRLACLKEHTTDHQVATARWLASKPGVYVAFAEEELHAAIALALSRSETAPDAVPQFAPEPFISRIRGALLQ